MFRYRADILPVSIVVAFFAFDVAAFIAAPWWIAAVVGVVGLLPKACICAWNHHHQHVQTFRWKYLNRALEVIYALQTGALPLAWELHHNAGHHVNYLDQSLDESRWKTLKGRQMGTHEYAMSVAGTAYFRIWKKAKVSSKTKRMQFLLWAIIVCLVVLLSLIVNPLNSLFLVITPMVAGLYITAWHTYYHHAGLDTDNKYEASWNILHTGYNILTLNLGYHTAHHVRCTVHWSELPAFHESIAEHIPARLYTRPCFPFTLLGKAKFPQDAPVPVAAK